MQETKFENQVQEQMEGLRLRPSDAVWEKVEKELREKKRRRFIFLLFLLAGLGLTGYTGYHLFKHPSSTNNLVQVTPVQKKINTAKKPAVSPANNSSVDHSDTPENESVPGTTTPEATITEATVEVKKDKLAEEQQHLPVTVIPSASGKQKTIAVSAVKQQPARKSGKLINKPLEEKDRVNSSSNDELVADKPKQSSREVASLIDNPLQQPATVLTESITADTTVVAKAPVERAKDSQSVVAGILTDTLLSANMPTATAIKLSSRKIRWAIDLSAGISKINDRKFLSFNKSLQDAMPDYQGGVTGPIGIPGRVNYAPSSIRQGIALTVGVLGEKKLSKRSSVLAGLQYNYYSSHISIGRYADTSLYLNNSFSQSVASGVYSGPQTNNYTNAYHFLRMPISYQLQLNKGVKTPITWDISIAPSLLVYSNALVFDTTLGGVYYKNKKLFNKLHLSAGTGFMIQVLTRKKISWSVGPYFSMDMKSIVKDSFLPRQYLIAAGLRTRFFLW